jgi:hypothetical protein
MEISKKRLLPVCWCIGLAILPAYAQQNSDSYRNPQMSSSELEVRTSVELPDSPGADRARTRQLTAATAVTLQAQAAAPKAQDQAASSQPQQTSQEQQTPAPQAQPVQASPSQTEPPQTEPQAQKPVGTAAAGAIPSTGVAASQPAGVAIAPAKQRRVRTIVLRVGAIIGAGVAVGSVIALTEATPSRPPGAH